MKSIAVVSSLSLVLFLIWGAWTVGYRLANPEEAGPAPKAVTQEGEGEEVFRARGRSSRGDALTLEAKDGSRDAQPFGRNRDRRPAASETMRESPYSSIISKHHLEGEYQAMAKVFPDTTTGDALRYTAALYKFRSATGTEEGQLVNELLELLKAHPTETYNDLRQNISKMSPEYSTERQYLMQLVSTLEVDRAAKLNFFTEELQRASGPFKTSDPASYNGMIALRSLLSETETPADLAPMLRDVLMREKDLGARAILISTYERFSPAEASKLRSEFVSE